LWQFELAEDEWVIAEEVCDMLKAHKYDNANYLSSHRSSRMQHFMSHMHPQTFQQ